MPDIFFDKSRYSGSYFYRTRNAEDDSSLPACLAIAAQFCQHSIVAADFLCVLKNRISEHKDH